MNYYYWTLSTQNKYMMIMDDNISGVTEEPHEIFSQWPLLHQDLNQIHKTKADG